MDELMINSKIMKWFICRLIRKSIKKKYGTDVDIQLSTFEFKADDEAATVHVDARIRANKDDFNRFLKSIGDK